MNPTLETFSQGEEIVTGHVIDTNAAWLSQQAVQLGFSVTRHTAVGDKLDDLVALLQEISTRADCCICTGGLGPTTDDLTTEAVAHAFGLPLVFDAFAFARMQQFFANRNKPMPEANRKQAMLPEGALRLDNDWGTAPGFAVQHQRCWFAFLPGVPSEMRPMFLEKILPTLPRRFSLKPSTLITLKTIGLGESDIQQRISAVAIPATVQLGFRASLNEVQTKLLFPNNYSITDRQSLVAQIAEPLGDHVFAIDGAGNQSGDLVAVVDALMTQHGKTLAVVETVSQGLLAGLCLGADWLLETRYEQSVGRLRSKLNITVAGDDLMAQAQIIATALQQGSDADYVLVQLYAGDKNQFNDRNQAIVLYNVLLAENGFKTATHTVAGSGKRKQNQAALLALDLLRRHLQQKA
ncbi:MAG: molybdopterin-binding protein [Methylovulum sp.]|nr:molybdopterin-binding protein [Methylovulum sp.]